MAAADDLFWIKTSRLMEIVNPFNGCWRDVLRPVSVNDVSLVMEGRGDGLPPEVVAHARKISDFVRTGFRDPISVDVGVPSLGFHVRYPIVDGNHRFASAIYRYLDLAEDRDLPVNLQGSVDLALQLGFRNSYERV